jgi:hypothetical protein
MPNKTVRINGIASGDKLDLDNRRVEVHTNTIYRKITWIKKTDQVKSFRIKGKTTVNPFEDPIPDSFDTRLELKVDKKAVDMDWEYTIEWLDMHNPPKSHFDDPLIAIRSKFAPETRPLTRESVSLKTWVFIGIGLIGLAWLLSENKRKRR